MDTSGVVLAEGTRLGTYYVQFAATPRTKEVIYDRAGSAFTELTTDMVDWEALLNARVLYLTGITPALGDGPYEVMLEAAWRAKASGVAVSFDVNYRSKLWTPEAARERLRSLLPFVDLLICGQADERMVFGFEGPSEVVLDALHALTPAEHVVLTRSHEGEVTCVGNEVAYIPAQTAIVVDRLGAGDAFAARVIDGFLDGDLHAGLGRGAALSAMALAQHGDMLTTGREELDAVLIETTGTLNC